MPSASPLLAVHFARDRRRFSPPSDTKPRHASLRFARRRLMPNISATHQAAATRQLDALPAAFDALDCRRRRQALLIRRHFSPEIYFISQSMTSAERYYLLHWSHYIELLAITPAFAAIFSFHWRPRHAELSAELTPRRRRHLAADATPLITPLLATFSPR